MLLEEHTIVKYEMNFPRHNWTTNGFWKLVKTISLSILKQIIIIIDTNKSFNPCPAVPQYILYWKQCKFRATGFFRRSQRIHNVLKKPAMFSMRHQKLMESSKCTGLKTDIFRGILFLPAGKGLIRASYLSDCLTLKHNWLKWYWFAKHCKPLFIWQPPLKKTVSKTIINICLFFLCSLYQSHTY